MRAKDWEILKVGDSITRIKRERSRNAPPPSPREPGVITGPDDAITVDTQVFQIVKIDKGLVTAVRLIDTTRLPGVRFVTTETIELMRSPALAERSEPFLGTVSYEWEYQAPARGEARLTGGFTVKRADGSVEYERCPTDTTRG